MRYDITVEGPDLAPGRAISMHDAIAEAIDKNNLGEAEFIHVRAVRAPLYVPTDWLTCVTEPEDDIRIPTRAKWVLALYVVAAAVVTAVSVACGIYRGEIW